MITQGRFLGQVPFGYNLAADGETLVANPDELEAIQYVKVKGYSLRAIAAERRGAIIPTNAGNKTWTHTAVQSILKRTA